MTTITHDENRLRRDLAKQHLRLQRCPSRDPQDPLYGTYQVVDPATGFPVFADWDRHRVYGRGYGLDLHDVAVWLSG